MEATFNSNEQDSKIGEFFFYFVNFWYFYVVLLLFCNMLKLHHDFLNKESRVWIKLQYLLNVYTEQMGANEQVSKIWEIFFNFVKFSYFYVVLLLFCNMLKLHHDFLNKESEVWTKLQYLLNVYTETNGSDI